MARLINVNYNPLRRSKGAVQDAKRSQYLEGDIRLSQRYADIGKQRLDLQQEQLNWNKYMVTANTIIQGTQAAVQVVQAAVSVHGAVDSMAKQKEMKTANAFKNELDTQVAMDVQSGKTRMTLDSNGNPTYTGLTPEAEAIRNKYRDSIQSEMGGLKLGNAGRAQETLDQIYSDTGAGTAKIVAAHSFQELRNTFNANIKDGIDQAVAGNDSFLREVLESGKGWMTEEAHNLYETEAWKAVESGVKKKDIINIAVSPEGKGMEGVKAKLSAPVEEGGYGLTEGDAAYADYWHAAEKARADYTEAPRKKLHDTYNLDQADLPRWVQNKDVTSINSALNRLERAEKDFIAVDGENQYVALRQKLLNAKDDVMGTRSGRGSGSSLADAKAEADWYVHQFHAGMPGEQAEAGIREALKDHPAELLERLKNIYAGPNKENTLLAMKLEPLLKTLTDMNDPKSKNHDPELAKDYLDQLAAWHFNTPDKNGEADDFIQKQTKSLNAKWLVSGLKNIEQWRDLEDSDVLDTMSQTMRDAYGNVTVKNTKGFEERQNEAIKLSNEVIGKATKGTDLKLVDGTVKPILDEGQQSSTGKLAGTLENSKGERWTVRAARDGKGMEMQDENGNWVPFDKNITDQGKAVKNEEFLRDMGGTTARNRAATKKELDNLMEDALKAETEMEGYHNLENAMMRIVGKYGYGGMPESDAAIDYKLKEFSRRWKEEHPPAEPQPKPKPRPPGARK